MWQLADNPERRFLVYKGRQTGHRQIGDRQMDDEQTTNERQTRDRRIESASQRCVPKSDNRVSNGEATESIGLSIKVVSVWNRIKNLLTYCSINLASKTHSSNIQHHVRNINPYIQEYQSLQNDLIHLLISFDKIILTLLRCYTLLSPE